MPDTFFSDWGLSPQDVPKAPDLGIGPTRSYDPKQFDQEWLGATQEVPPVVTAPPPNIASNIMKVFPFSMIPPAANAVAAPGNALKTTWQNPVTSEELIQPATNLAGLVATGAMPSVVRAGESSIPAINSLAAALRPAVKPLIDPATASLASLARDKFGIPIRGGQISESPSMNYLDSLVKGKPFSGMAENEATQHAAFNRAVAKTIGEDAEKVTPDVMANAKTRLGQNYEDIARQTTLKVDQPLTDILNKIVTDASTVLQPSEHSIITKQIQGILDKVKGEGTIDGATFHALIKKGSPLDRATNSSDSNVKYYAGQIKSALVDAMGRSAPEDMKGLLKTTNSQYKAMKTIEDLVEKSPTGDISPALLMGAVRKSYSNMAYGGGGDLADLARIGQRFLKDMPQSGTQPRMSAAKLLSLGGAGGADLAVSVHDPILALKLAGLAATAGVGKTLTTAALGRFMRSNYYANRLIDRSLPGATAGPNLLQKLVNSNVPYLPPAGAAMPMLPFLQQAQ